jgi:hypothetical protein
MIDPRTPHHPITLFQSEGSDTSFPRCLVPVFVMHAVTNPFCSHPLCECHTNQAQIARLLHKEAAEVQI